MQFKTQELQTAWNEWMQERKERKLKKYTERGLKAAITHLLNISNNNEQTAVDIINQSISQGWQGLFPLKNVSHATNRTSTNEPNHRNGTSVDRIEALRNW